MIIPSATPPLIKPDNLPVVYKDIWVVDPHSGQRVNVKAFLKALNDFEPGYDADLNKGALDSVKRILRFLSLIEHNPVTTDPIELSNIFNDLWRLWDMFDETSVVRAQKD